MSVRVDSFRRLSLRLICISAALIAGSAADVTAQDAGAPPWGEYLKKFKRDKLLKKPFHMDPEEGVKGLASKIRARELDIPNRKKAIRYLRELDCVQFPEAKEMLLSLLDPQAEKWEEVRFEAAKGLQYMLSRHSCAPQNQKGNSQQCRNGNNCNNCNQCNNQGGIWQQCRQSAEGNSSRRGKNQPPEEPCHCRSCCDAKTLNTLAKTAYEIKENGCHYEPSLRVREMAAEAIKACGVPCHYGPYRANGNEEIAPTPADEAGAPGKGPQKTEEGNDSGGEVTPVPSDEVNPAENPGDSSTMVPVPMLIPTLVAETVVTEPAVTEPVVTEPAVAPAPTAGPTPISRLQGICVVSLKAGQQVESRAEFSATYRGRIYYFASLEAQQQFENQPEDYAVAFGGCDPVDFVEARRIVEGRYLVRHENRFFMFSTRENHKRFKANPARYCTESATGARLASAK